MLKIMHNGTLWFIEHGGKLYCRHRWCTTLEEWDEVVDLLEDDYNDLKDEFPTSLARFHSSPDGGGYTLKGPPPIVHVREVTPAERRRAEQFFVKTVFLTSKKS